MAKRHPSPTQERLRHLFSYEPETGQLVRLVKIKRANVGDVAGTLTTKGRLIVRVDGKCYHLARIVWSWFYGGDAPLIVDHVNGDPLDNRIANLRAANYSQNAANIRVRRGKSGIPGVRFRYGSWVAEIEHNHRPIHIGSFRSKDEAIAARASVARKLFGEFIPGGGV